MPTFTPHNQALVIGPELDQNVTKNEALCSPYRNFCFLDPEKLENLREKLAVCGFDMTQFYHVERDEFFELPVFCDNRACDSDGCKKHRGYKFRRAHAHQIFFMEQNIGKPKAWVFTGWKIPLDQLDRRFLQEQLHRLFRLMSKFSFTAFSIHMEIKLYPICHKDYGMAYVHFHVVSGGVRRLRLLRKLWGRQIKYEDAICLENLVAYVSKYAAKTPVFGCGVDREYYHCLVYKLQMHRFSHCMSDCSGYGKVVSNVINWDVLEMEVYYCLRRDEKGFHPFIDGYLRRGIPPPVDLESYG